MGKPICTITRFLPRTVPNGIWKSAAVPTQTSVLTPRHCQFDHLYLSDPLIRTYVKFKLTFVAERYRNADCMLDASHPLEELPFADNYFDLGVMINVLDHVRDAGQCMKNLIRVIKPGGILILGQDLTNEEDLVALKDDPERSVIQSN